MGMAFRRAAQSTSLLDRVDRVIDVVPVLATDRSSGQARRDTYFRSVRIHAHDGPVGLGLTVPDESVASR
jgi:hypothetical protein